MSLKQKRKKMKKIFLIAVGFTAICTTGFSQTKFGIQIGGNLGYNRVETNTSDKFSDKPRLGILAGFLADIPLGPVSFRPELNFIQKGAKYFQTTTIGNAVFEDEIKLRTNYVELPLNFVYNVQTGGGKFFFGLGPNFALGLSGKTEYQEKITTGPTTVTSNGKTDVKFSGDNAAPNTTYLKRFDFGGNLLAGYAAGTGVTFNIGYTLGFSDIARNTPGIDYSRKNHGFTFKVGYLFGGSGSSKPTGSGTSTGSGTF